MSAPYERVELDGRSWFVCAKCRRAHRPGTDSPYGFPEPGGIPTKSERKQSLCGACYREAYAFMYPPVFFPNQPMVEDNAFGDPIPYNLGLHPMAPKTKQQVWGEAFATYQREGGDPQAIFEALWEEEQRGQVVAEVTEVQVTSPDQAVVEVRRE